MRRPALLIVAALALLGCPVKTPPTLFTPGEELQIDDPSGALLRRFAVQIQVDALIPGRETTLVFPLPGRRIAVSLTPVDPQALALPSGSAAWTGTVEGGGEAFVMRIGRSVEASVQTRDRLYRLRTVDGRRGVLEVYDPARFRESVDDGVVVPPREPADARPDSSCEDAGDRIDVMVLYTPATRDASGGVQAIENEIAFAVGRTNLAYRNGNVAHRLNLIHTGVVDYTEPAAGIDSNALLGQLASTSDGVLDEIHGLRDGLRADLVSLVYEADTPAWCGWGHLQETANADTTDQAAFSVVKRSCAGGYLSFAHETGHNLGAKHDRANADGSLDFNYGHIEPTPSLTTTLPWRTVMSYPSPCAGESATGSCARVPWFSNPDVMRLGDRAGVPLTAAEPEHNAEVFARNDGEVSRYRCLQQATPGPNVWMKDRWEDQGFEPDPATAGRPMWESPYIWVRHEEDAELEHQHEHENPVLGQTNYVYVKLHNTGTAAQSGQLELYFANASTNLNDPASWTRLDSRTVIADEAVEVVELTWDDLPAAGHYCLLARWNTDGSILSFTDVGAAVRASNDLVWRNVSIQDLGSDAEADYDIEVVGTEAARETYLLVRATPRRVIPLAWTDLARARLRVDPAVIDEPRPRIQAEARPNQGSFELPLDGRPRLVGPLVLQPDQSTQVTLRVVGDPAQVRQASAQLAQPAELDLVVSQITAGAAELALQDPEAVLEQPGAVIGGVTVRLRVPAAR